MKIEAFLAIFGCFSYCVVNGGFYIWGIISIYVISYFRIFDESVHYSSLMMMTLLRGFLILILLPLGTLIELYYDKKKSLLIGIVFFIGSMSICAFTINFYIFSFFFALAFASNNTIGYSIIQEAAWKYFPKNKGLANGIIYLGFFISSIISIFTHYIVNWDDIKPNLIIKSEYGSELYYDNEISMNVRQMLLMLLIVWSILLSCSYYFVRYPSESYLESIENISKTDKKFDRRKTIDIYYTNYKEALFSNRFIIIIAVNTIAFLMDFHLSFSFKRFTINYNYSDEFVTIVGSFLPAIN